MKLEFQLFDFAEFKAKMQQLKEKKHFDYLVRRGRTRMCLYPRKY